MKMDKFKEQVSFAALNYIKPGSIIGIGSGSTISYFIKALYDIKNNIKGVISSSNTSSMQLKKTGIPLLNLNDIDFLDVYVDSADEVNQNMQMIKGGGGALTREKIIASVAYKFICIIDISKQVDILGSNFPLPIEVIPMSRSYVSRELVKFGGRPKYRHSVITDNGNNIIDVYNLKILDPVLLEKNINNIPGVVTVGLFAQRSADIVLIGSDKGIKIIQ